MAVARTIVASSLLSAALLSVAHAADMPQLPAPPPLVQGPTMVEDVMSGWYLRGDVGFRSNIVSEVTGSPGLPSATDNSLGKSTGFGGGAGFKAGWIRADLTVDYSGKVGYTGSVFAPDDLTAKVSYLSALFNVYFDLGTWYGLTPYVGAGVGGARLSVSDGTITVPPFGPTDPTTTSKWNVAWAGTAGLSFNLTRNLLLDGSYRYLNFGNVTVPLDGFGTATARRLAAHEFRIGVRWLFNDPLPLQ